MVTRNKRSAEEKIRIVMESMTTNITVAELVPQVQCVVNAISSEKPDVSRLLIRTDNGSQYVSKKFRESVIILGARQEFIYYNTPEQNGHVEVISQDTEKRVHLALRVCKLSAS